jgi:hypothetical protein
MPADGNVRPLDQKSRRKSGRRMGMLTLMIPTMVSRTPQELTTMIEGLGTTENTTRRMLVTLETLNHDNKSEPTQQ